MDLSDDDKEMPWPKKGDTLFTASEDWWHNACLNYAGTDWGLYAKGYLQAGDVLVEHIKETHARQDFLVYPIVFLYRQYLELRLKQLIAYGQRILDNPPDFPKTHQLDKLWAICRVTLKKIEQTIPDQDLEAIDEAISQFCAVDPTSEGFRYPTNKEGQPSLPDELKYINVRNLAEVMARVGSFFESATMMISYYRDLKIDMDNAYRDAYGY